MYGYTRVAALMAKHPEFAILRGFKTLNYQNLLYLQAEITHLEAELQAQAEIDARHPERRLYKHDWWQLANNDDDDDDGRKQWLIAAKIREKLREYSKNLLIFF